MTKLKVKYKADLGTEINNIIKGYKAGKDHLKISLMDIARNVANRTTSDKRPIIERQFDPGRYYLLDEKTRQPIFESNGYKRVYDNNYGLVNKAVNNRNIPIYQIGEDEIDYNRVTPIGITINDNDAETRFKTKLLHAGSFPIAIYKGDDGEYYNRQFDLNDYGSNNGTGGQKYGLRQIGAELLDVVGNPFVQRSGLGRINLNDYLYGKDANNSLQVKNYADGLVDLYKHAGNKNIRDKAEKYLKFIFSSNHNSGLYDYNLTGEDPEFINFIEEHMPGVRLLHNSGFETKPLGGDKNTPIKNPVVPKSADKVSINWLANWLNNRRFQLYNNLQNVDNRFEWYSKPKNKIKGDIRDDGYNVQYIDNYENPLLYLKGENPARIKINREYYRQLNNSASAPEIILNGTVGNTRGAYVKPNYFNNTGHYIVYPNVPYRRTMIHERTHALNADPQEATIAKYLDTKKYNDEYLDDPAEIYARLNEYRYENKLNPNSIITTDYLKNNKDKLKQYRLDRYDDNFLIKLFNDIAYNVGNNTINDMARYGKNIKLSNKLVPNIIRGGNAEELGNNFYYMNGRTHKQGGIDIGKNLEVEDGEVIKITPKNIRVYSAQPIINGISPAEAVINGANPNTVFKYQEEFKDRFGLNDDGTRKRKVKYT